MVRGRHRRRLLQAGVKPHLLGKSQSVWKVWNHPEKQVCFSGWIFVPVVPGITRDSNAAAHFLLLMPELRLYARQRRMGSLILSRLSGCGFVETENKKHSAGVRGSGRAVVRPVDSASPAFNRKIRPHQKCGQSHRWTSHGRRGHGWRCGTYPVS